MPYLHKQKWGAAESLGKRSLVIDPHMYSASVGTIRVSMPRGGGIPDEDGTVVFWRSKTRTSSYAEWMELHDASDGATLWRAESRYSDRAAPVTVTDPVTGRERTEYLTVVRLYLESETRPRLMIVHRDARPAGLTSARASRSLAVYTLDLDGGSAGGGGAGGRQSSGRGGGRNSTAAPPSAGTIGGVSLEEPADQFDFADLPAGEDIFQLTLNNTLTTVALTAVRLPGGDKMSYQAAMQGDVRTLARMKRLGEAAPRTLDIDGGLDVPLVTMLLTTVDQLMLSHEAIDYDVAWPSDYAFAHGECFSTRKREAQKLKDLSDNGMQTEDDQPWATEKPRMCFGLF
mmetsp:Transcript_50151/g.130575  ORF Transcript_50151/g.130575 Transcript_50151/m.130575 type:complete len:344 (-) Transcript_50151:57-1088(-)